MIGLTPVELEQMLRTMFAAGYGAAVRATCEATERLGMAAGDPDMEAWQNALLTVDERDELARYAAALLATRKDGHHQ